MAGIERKTTITSGKADTRKQTVKLNKENPPLSRCPPLSVCSRLRTFHSIDVVAPSQRPRRWCPSRYKSSFYWPCAWVLPLEFTRPPPLHPSILHSISSSDSPLESVWCSLWGWPSVPHPTLFSTVSPVGFCVPSIRCLAATPVRRIYWAIALAPMFVYIAYYPSRSEKNPLGEENSSAYVSR